MGVVLAAMAVSFPTRVAAQDGYWVLERVKTDFWKTDDVTRTKVSGSEGDLTAESVRDVGSMQWVAVHRYTWTRPPATLIPGRKLEVVCGVERKRISYTAPDPPHRPPNVEWGGAVTAVGIRTALNAPPGGGPIADAVMGLPPHPPSVSCKTRESSIVPGYWGSDRMEITFDFFVGHLHRGYVQIRNQYVWRPGALGAGPEPAAPVVDDAAGMFTSGGGNPNKPDDPNSGGGGGTRTTDASCGVISQLAWKGATQDRVGPGGIASADGLPDVNLGVSLDLPASSTLDHLSLFTTDAAGNKGPYHWFSGPNDALWILGVFKDGVLLNPARQSPLGPRSGRVDLDIFGTYNGQNADTQHYLVEATVSGTVHRCRVGPGTASVPGACGDPSGVSGATSPATAAETTLEAAKRSVKPGTRFVLPVWLAKATNVGSMNIVVRFDAAVIRPDGPPKSGRLLGAEVSKAVNPNTEGVVEFGFAAGSTGVSGTDSLIELPLRAVGKAGSRTPIRLEIKNAESPENTPVRVARIDGAVDIVDCAPPPPPLGDCDGDGVLEAADALCALQMSVNLKTVDLKMDMDGNGRVTAADANIILRKVVGR